MWAAKTDNFLELGTNIFKGCGSGKNQNGTRVAVELTENMPSGIYRVKCIPVNNMMNGDNNERS